MCTSVVKIKRNNIVFKCFPVGPFKEGIFLVYYHEVCVEKRMSTFYINYDRTVPFCGTPKKHRMSRFRFHFFHFSADSFVESERGCAVTFVRRSANR